MIWPNVNWKMVALFILVAAAVLLSNLAI